MMVVTQIAATMMARMRVRKGMRMTAQMPRRCQGLLWFMLHVILHMSRAVFSLIVPSSLSF